MSKPSFKMLVTQGDDASLYDKKLVSEVNGLPKAGYVFTIYARLHDFSQLDVANTLEVREKAQLTCEKDDQGNTVTVLLNRVNEDGYYLTTKLSRVNTQAVEQVNVPLSEAAYNHMVRVSEYSTPFERFKIPTLKPGVEWEIDVFRTASGKQHEWVKMDLEVDDLNDEVPSLPIQVEEYILDFPGIVTKEQKKFIQRLWAKDWYSQDPDWVKTQVDFKSQFNIEPEE